ncbi:cyclic AMP-responsive element-binding protein 3-like protein 2 isoform X2 [Cryptotermes secundus]|uniref:cyclic AMP-responsive element-binding protein 3-like protein 2 isoform X2 n=1 Tax=Cryptotermes secundus TaxID=105785 RepID=UPI000CD7AB15|nr:cyclic AMP-responsive element-binding protein 3-like protein 2 isoform X2 [Cryptotermes secundus]
MEFPDLGKHCSDPTCKQLDYLPLKCEACENIFCREHVSYKSHACPSAYKKDVQVPVCPLCNTPIPVKRGVQPDIAVGAHIDSDCMSDPAKNRRKVFTNKCSGKNCHVKEIVPVMCSECKLNFCLKHRHPADHQCEGAAGTARMRALEAAVARQANLHAVDASLSSHSPKPIKSEPTEPETSAAGIQGGLAISEAFKMATDPDLEWTATILDVKPQVILHDRLMTDAALGTAPIKSEHSYSLTSDGDSIPDSPLSLDNKMDDMENECFPCIPLVAARSRESDSPIVVKEEPMSEPGSPDSCPMSPTSPQSLIHTDAKYDPHKTASQQQSVLKQPTILLTTRSNLFSQQNRVVIPKLNIKLETNRTAGFPLPPTPPSSTASDSEGNVSPDHNPSSPSRHMRQQQQQHQHNGTTRLLVSSNTSTPAASNRQPIQTPLISNQPKGSTGMLLLTEEEKRTLLAEGYPIPTRLPLTKAEEKSLKKIRRKIKNKISAQESRRKKKEYMDALERKVEVLTGENTDYKKKIESLEENNASLLSQLQKLQALVARSSTASTTGTSTRVVRHTDTTTFTSSHMNQQHITRSSIK